MDGDVVSRSSAPFTAAIYPPRAKHACTRVAEPEGSARARADRVLGRRRRRLSQPPRSRLRASLREHERVLTDAGSLAATYSARPSAGYEGGHSGKRGRVDHQHAHSLLCKM